MPDGKTEPSERAECPAFRVKALTIVCTDLERSSRFYETVLGAIRDPRDGYGCRWYTLGTILISLVPNATKPASERSLDQPTAMLSLEADDLNAADGRFARMGVEIVESSDGQSMLIADPDGILIEVWQSEV